jgi:hypothetical protein
MDPDGVIRAVATGKAPLSDLAPFGVVLDGEPPHISLTVPSEIPDVHVSLGELSTGLLAACARCADVAEWAFVTRELVTVAGEDTPEWEVLMDALWSAAFGVGASEEALAMARSLAQ